MKRCSKCSYENTDMSKYCVNCGADLQEQINLESNINNQVENSINNNTFYQSEGQYQNNNNMNTLENSTTNIFDTNTFNNVANNNLNYNSTSKELDTVSNQNTVVENPNINNVSMQSQMNSNVYHQPANPINLQQNNINVTEKDETDKKTKISFIIGIVAIVLSFFLNLFVIPLSVTGLIFGIKSKDRSKKKKIGIILNISSMAIAIIVLIIGSLALNLSGKTSTYYGSGYQLEYDKNWTISELSGGQEALQYKYQNSYLVPVGKSTLTQYTNNLNCDFDESSCKESLYNKFYDYWSTNMPSDSLYLYKDTDLFKSLKDNIYYAKYDYGISMDNLRGNYYLVVSKEKDVILSFMSNAKAKNTKLLDKEIIKLFKKMEIDDNSNVTVVEDDEMSDLLSSMSNWNRYSDLRSGTLAKKATINGGWRKLDDSEEYWEFKDGKFWWYESVNNLNDNYYYGTTKIATGLEGLKSVGLSEDNLKNVLSSANGKISQNDVYAVICTPTKLISGGEDKSSTKIPEGSKLNYVWIVINHDSEGIEGQVMNLQSYGISYYVKIKD